jgi:predicted GNAT family acetyltransferase
MATSTYTVFNNENEQRFEVHEGDETTYLEYRYYKKDIALMHTFVPENLEGRGIASSLAHHALEWAREHKKPVVVYCPYVATYLKRHPEYNEAIDKNYIG